MVAVTIGQAGFYLDCFECFNKIAYKITGYSGVNNNDLKAGLHLAGGVAGWHFQMDDPGTASVIQVKSP